MRPPSRTKSKSCSTKCGNITGVRADAPTGASSWVGRLGRGLFSWKAPSIRRPDVSVTANTMWMFPRSSRSRVASRSEFWSARLVTGATRIVNGTTTARVPVAVRW